MENKEQKDSLERIAEALEDIACSLQCIEIDLESLGEITECIINEKGRKYLSTAPVVQ